MYKQASEDARAHSEMVLRSQRRLRNLRRSRWWLEYTQSRVNSPELLRAVAPEPFKRNPFGWLRRVFFSLWLRKPARPLGN